jgi:hypothetical protein
MDKKSTMMFTFLVRWQHTISNNPEASFEIALFPL